MRHQFKRGMSMLLVLVMVVSLLSGLTMHVHAAEYSYNQGRRGVAATSLSAAAKNFYSNTPYETLASYAGSADVNSVPSSPLYTQLQNLMASKHSHKTGYDETRGLYQYTDCQQGGTWEDGKISSFYSGTSIGPAWDSGATWNREHTWPKSKAPDGSSEENDIMMLRPTAKDENGSRSNTAYGRSSGYFDPNIGSYNLHGDVARITLYVYTRWGNTSYMWGTSGVMESKDVLLDWMAEDPVDTWELSRNDVVQQITGTRNVFVDYPELAFLLFGEEIPAGMTTPSGNANKTYTVTATVNDSTMGTVTVSGSNIAAEPAEGYMVSGYELISGTATVTQSGNGFVVNATSDCTIQVNFAPRTQVTITYADNGQTLTTATAYSGDVVTLPGYTGTAPEGYTFLGWSDVTVSHTDEIPTYYQTGKNYTASGNVTLHALFSYVAAGEGGSGIWTLVTDASALKAGEQIVLAENSKSAVSGPLSGKFLTSVSATFSADKKTIPTLPSGAQTFTLGGSEGAWTLTGANDKLLGATAAKALSYTGGTTKWSISISSNKATVQNGNSSCGRFLYNVGSPRFLNYTSNTSTSMLLPQIYMLSASETTYYTTASCKHQNTENVAAQAGNCTTDGYTAGVFCHDCSTYISGHEPIEAPGHNYESVVTPPTATEDGYTTYTCSRCGDSYVADEVPALGETYTVSFSVPEGMEKIDEMTCNTAGITLPETESPDGYTFLGWTTGPVENSETEPTYYEGGSNYVAASDITLYALYRQAEGGSGEKEYLLVEELGQLTVGSKIVIAAAKEAVAMSTEQSNNNRGQVVITKNADKTITLAPNVAELTLGEGKVANTWSFYCPANNGYLYAASSSKNYLRTKETLDNNGSFAITLGSNGIATVKAQGDKTRNWLRYNTSNDIFSCYGSGQNDICLYVETVSGTVTYTTEIKIQGGEQPHIHTGVFQKADPATCTEAGTIAHYLCSCGKKFADEDCTEELTSIVDPQKAHNFTAKTVDEKYKKSDATCQSPAEYYLSCTVCGLTSKGTANEGTFTNGNPDTEGHGKQTYVLNKKDATCTEDGYSGDTYCALCNNEIEKGQTIPAKHDLDEVAAKAATCKEEGIEGHYKCSVCKKLFSDEKATKELSAADVVIPKNPHNHTISKKDANEHWKECECGDKSEVTTHSYGKFLTSKTEHWKECSCGHETERGKHTFGAWETVQKARVGAEGERKRTCTVCDYVETETIPEATTPSTGDNAPIVLYVVMMVLATAALVLLLILRPKKGKYGR